MALQAQQPEVPHPAIGIRAVGECRPAGPVTNCVPRGLPGSLLIPPNPKGASSSDAPWSRAAAIPTEDETELSQAAVVDMAWIALKIAASCSVTVSELRNGTPGAGRLSRARLVFILVCTELTSLRRDEMATYLGIAEVSIAPEIERASSAERTLAQTIATALVKERRRTGAKP